MHVCVCDTHLPCLISLFDLNIELKRSDKSRAGAAWAPWYPRVIGSDVDLRNTWRMHFDYTKTHTHHDTHTPLYILLFKKVVLSFKTSVVHICCIHPCLLGQTVLHPLTPWLCRTVFNSGLMTSFLDNYPKYVMISSWLNTVVGHFDQRTTEA